MVKKSWWAALVHILLFGLLVQACSGGDLPLDMDAEADTDGGSADTADTDSDTLPTSDTTGGEDTETTEDEVTTGEPDNLFDLNKYILGLGHLPVLPQQDPQQEECEGDNCLQDDPESKFACVFEYFNAVDHYEEFVATSPNSNALFAGATVRGDQAKNALLTLLGTLPRADITASVSLPNLGGPVSFTYNPEKLSEYRDGLYGVLNAEINGDSPTIMQLQMRRIFTQSDLSIALGTNVEWAGNKVTNMFTFDKMVNKTQIAVSMTEAYYTVDIDTPLKPADYFAEDVKEEDAKAVMYAGNPPMVIPSVTYGRHVIFSLESTYSEEKVGDAFSAAFNFVVKAGVDLTVEQKSILDEMEIKALVMGGQNASQVILGYEGLIQFILDGKGFNINDKGVPIGYKLAHLDGEDMKLALATQYAEATCAEAYTLKITAHQFAVLDDAEGSGNSEFMWWGKVTGGGQPECTLIEQDKIFELKSVYVRDYNPPGECFIKFSADEPVSFTIHHWAGEFTKGGSLEVDDEVSKTYTYDPEDQVEGEGITLSPPLGGYMLETYDAGDGTPLRTRMWGGVGLK